VLKPNCDPSGHNPLDELGDIPILPGRLLNIACPPGEVGENTIYCSFAGWDESQGENNCEIVLVEEVVAEEAESTDLSAMLAAAGVGGALLLAGFFWLVIRKKKEKKKEISQ